MKHRKLIDPQYLKFPFSMTADGPEASRRKAHVREQIEQVLFTNPGERIFRPSFGAGIRRLVFEPNTASLKEVVQKRLAASLQEALQGEVDPRTLEINITRDNEKLTISISYMLATIGYREVHDFTLSPGGGDG